MIEDDSRTVLGYFAWLLFSFEGRLDRRTYRYCRFGANLLYALGLYGLRAQLLALIANPASAILLIMSVLGVTGLMAWTTLAMQVKRRHDQDKSWYWLFLGFIPIFGPVWVLIETCWIDGTRGYNRFDQPAKLAAAAFA